MPAVNQVPDPTVPARHPVLIVLWLVLALAYLTASATGFRMLATSVVGLMAGALLVASGRPVAGTAAAVTLVGLCVYFSAYMQFIVYAPPLAAFAFMAYFFYRTLRPGSEPLITRVARMEHPDLPPDMARHARMLTWAWSLCFALLFVVALVLAPLLQLDVWSKWVHGLGYILPGALFLGEYTYRHYRFRERPHGSLLVLIPNIVRVSRDAAVSSGRRDTETCP
ncbi:MAG: hypothetical protein LH481_09255 [Burkholderiales bacterium]|nr:hypothetical protein [Burkholderiales bacterium]